MAINRRQPMPPQSQPQWYGQTPPAGTLGVELWRGHNGVETWSDDGASERVVVQHAETLSAGIDQLVGQLQQDVVEDMQAVISSQVQHAILEYAQTVEFLTAAIDGEICIGVTGR